MTNSAMIKAADREHSIKLTTYFYTDGIASDVKGEVIPKHCWDQGVIAVKANKSHQIGGGLEGKIVFNSIIEQPMKVLRAIERNQIKLHLQYKSAKLLGVKTGTVATKAMVAKLFKIMLANFDELSH